jgi:acetyl-CoA/propionyl-CoA carboxylase biotin carboxyl carrier protein
MVAKLIVHGADREHARRRMLRALEEFELAGVPTLLGFHRALLEHPCFVAGETCHGVVESEELARRAEEIPAPGRRTAAAGGSARIVDAATTVEVDGRRYEVRRLVPEPPWLELARRRRERSTSGAGGGETVVSPMQGTVLAVEVADGDTVAAGQVLCVVEAMKMENEITAHHDGVVTELSVSAGDAVQSGQVICVVAGDGRPG